MHVYADKRQNYNEVPRICIHYFQNFKMVDNVQKNRPHYLDCQKLSTQRALPRKYAKDSQTFLTKIFVGGIKQSTTEDQIFEVFSSFGVIKNIKIMLSKKKQSRGFCYITFHDYDSVDQCVLRHHIYLDGVYVEVKKAKPKDACIENQRLKSNGW